MASASTFRRPERLGSLHSNNPLTFTAPKRRTAAPTPRVEKPLPRCCDNPNISTDDRGRVCYTCGETFEDADIVAEVQFGETASGAAMVQGGFINENQRHVNTMGGTMRGLGGMESREQTEMNGRTEITKLGSALNLPQALQENAMSWYKLALNHSFVQGRRIRNVAAVAIYLAARKRPGNTLLLMDLAEKVQVNVWALGDTYKAFLKTIMEEDPSNLANTTTVQEIEPLMLKFCRKLEFGSDAHRVADDACKVLKRMKRDWMVQGRNPAGLCGACIILGARMNNFRRTVREVVYVVRVADTTVSQRLYEFKRTPASVLTVNQFRDLGARLKVKSLPPAIWKRAERERRAEDRRRKELGVDGNTSEEEEDEDEDEEERTDRDSPELASSKATKRKRTARQEAIARKNQKKTHNQSGEGEEEAKADRTDQHSPAARPSTSSKRKRTAKQSAGAQKKQTNTGKPAPVDSQQTPWNPASQAAGDSQATAEGSQEAAIDVEALEAGDDDPALDGIAEAFEDDDEEELIIPKKRGRKPKPREPVVVPPEDLEIEADLEREINANIRDLEATFKEFADNPGHPLLNEAAKTAIKMSKMHKPNAGISDEADIGEDEFEDDPDVRSCVLAPHEVRMKERVWITVNEDWLREQQKKMLQQALEEAQGKPKKIKRTRKRYQMGDGSVLGGKPAANAAEAAQKMLERNAKTFSNKLNYDIMQGLFTASATEGSTPAASTQDQPSPEESGSASAATPGGAQINYDILAEITGSTIPEGLTPGSGPVATPSDTGAAASTPRPHPAQATPARTLAAPAAAEAEADEEDEDEGDYDEEEEDEPVDEFEDPGHYSDNEGFDDDENYDF